MGHTKQLHSSSKLSSEPLTTNKPFTATMFGLKIVSLMALASAAVTDPLERRQSGTANFYSQNGNPGSCGTVHGDYDYVVALPYSANPSANCGRSVHIQSGGTPITAKAADTCPSCEAGHIDLSMGAFDALGSR